jgi:DNA-binding MarR family transcriptional regulator
MRFSGRSRLGFGEAELRTVKQILDGIAARGRTKVRRHSRLAGQEGGFWKPFDPRDKLRRQKAAERFEFSTRPKGHVNGALGRVGLEVHAYLLRVIDYASGTLCPSIARICAAIGRSRDAVVRALAKLRAAGFIDWIRRYVDAGNAGERGVQVRQTTNAYRLMLPARAAALLDKADSPAPLSDDERARRHAASLRVAIGGLPLWSQARAMIDDPDLAEAVAALAPDNPQRESSARAENQPGLFDSMAV